MIILFIVASVTFLAASILDARSSIGKHELTRIYQDKDHRFSLARYVAWSAGAFAVWLLLGLFGGVWLWSALGMLGTAAWRVYAWRHNRALEVRR